LVNKYIVRSPRRYVQITPGALYEIHIQNLVAKHVADLFSGYVGARFEPLIRTIGGDVRPDLVIVNLDKRRWAVVEVELGNHNFHAHVLPQMSKLAHCDDGLAFVEKFASLPTVDTPVSELLDIFSSKPSAILVTHGSSEHHSVSLERLGVQCVDLDVFECIEGPNDYILVVNDRRTHLVPLPVIAVRRTYPWEMNWEVSGDIPDAMFKDAQIIVHLGGTVAAWRRTKIGETQYLISPSDLAIDTGSNQRRVFLDDESGEIHLV
jgi:hypothetical protein